MKKSLLFLLLVSSIMLLSIVFSLSKRALPIFVFLFGSWSIYNAIRGLIIGEIIVAVGLVYRREIQPFLFYTAVILNLIIGSFLIILSLITLI